MSLFGPYRISATLWTAFTHRAQNPIVYGGYVYAFTRYEVLRSTDGETWAEVNPDGLGFCAAVAKYDGGRYVYAALRTLAVPDIQVRIDRYDLENNTWDWAANTPGPLSTAFGPQLHMERRTDGTFVVVTDNYEGAGDTRIIQTASYDQGADTWSAYSQLDDVAGTDPYTISACLDGSDRLHVFWFHVGVADTIYCRYYDATGTLQAASKTAAVLTVPVGTDVYDLAGCAPAYDPATDSIMLGVLDNSGADVKVLTGTPSSDPTWSLSAKLNDAHAAPSILGWTWGSIVVDGADVYLFYTTQADDWYDPNFLVHNKLTGGVWADEAVVYDSSVWDEPSGIYDLSASKQSGLGYSFWFGLRRGEYPTCNLAAVAGWEPASVQTLTVNKVLIPSDDSGLFDLQIDGATEASDQGDGGTTGPIQVTVGAHTVGEIAGTATHLSDYASVIGGDAAPDGSITLAAGENKVAVITNTRYSPPEPPVGWPGSGVNDHMLLVDLDEGRARPEYD